MYFRSWANFMGASERMRILYLSCHSVNEYEDILMFTELGHEVVSQGTYRDPRNPGDKSRPPIDKAYYNEKLARIAPSLWGERINKSLIEWCDVIYILGIEAWLPTNWEQMKHKHVVFRSIGQSVERTENVLARYRPQGLKIVRYSPFERAIPGYVGGDVEIRFYKDPEEYKGWNGKVKQVITVAQAMKKRDDALKFHLFQKATKGFPRKLYGHGNDDIGELWGGSLSYEELKKTYRDNRVFFYTCTFPAPYTMGFIEAWMTGIPVVAIGSSLASFHLEVPFLIDNGVNGFTSNNILDLRGYISMLLEDDDLAKTISIEGRKKAIELFDKDKIRNQWRALFESLAIRG